MFSRTAKLMVFLGPSAFTAGCPSPVARRITEKPGPDPYAIELKKRAGMEQAQYLAPFFHGPQLQQPSSAFSTGRVLWRLDRALDVPKSKFSIIDSAGREITIQSWKAHVPQTVTSIADADTVVFSGDAWDWRTCHLGEVLLVDAQERSGELVIRAAEQGFRAVVFHHRTAESYGSAVTLGDYSQIVVIDALAENGDALIASKKLKIDISLEPVAGTDTRNLFGYLKGRSAPDELVLLVTTYGTEGYDNTAGLAILVRLIKSLQGRSLSRSVGFAAVYGKSPFRNTASLLTRQIAQERFKKVLVLDFHFATGEMGRLGVRVAPLRTPFTNAVDAPYARLRSLLASSGLKILPARRRGEMYGSGSGMDFFVARIPGIMVYANSPTAGGFTAAEIALVERAIHTWVLELADGREIPDFLDAKAAKCHVAP